MLYSILYGVLVVGGLCLLALLGFELVHRLVPAGSRRLAPARGGAPTTWPASSTRLWA